MTTDELAERLAEHSVRDERNFADIREDLREMRDDLRVIRRVLVDGDVPLTVQVARNTERLDAIEPQIERLSAAADAGRFDKKTWAAIVIAAIAFLGTIGPKILDYIVG